MSNYTKTIKFEQEFDGDVVIGDFSRFKNKHLATIMPHVSTLQKNVDADGKLQMNAKEMAAMVDDCKEAVIDCCRDFKGLFDSDGAEVTLKEVFDDMYFMGLAFSITLFVLNNSFVSRDDEKKSEGP